MTVLPEKFIRININDLPNGKVPKYKVGDLVQIVTNSDLSPYGFKVKEGIGIVSGIIAFKVIGFDYYSPEPIYIIEYKILRADKHDQCYVLEGSIELIKRAT